MTAMMTRYCDLCEERLAVKVRKPSDGDKSVWESEVIWTWRTLGISYWVDSSSESAICQCCVTRIFKTQTDAVEFLEMAGWERKQVSDD